MQVVFVHLLTMSEIRIHPAIMQRVPFRPGKLGHRNKLVPLVQEFGNQFQCRIYALRMYIMHKDDVPVFDASHDCIDCLLCIPRPILPVPDSRLLLKRPPHI